MNHYKWCCWCCCCCQWQWCDVNVISKQQRTQYREGSENTSQVLDYLCISSQIECERTFAQLCCWSSVSQLKFGDSIKKIKAGFTPDFTTLSDCFWREGSKQTRKNIYTKMIINTHETSQDISAILCKILDAGWNTFGYNFDWIYFGIWFWMYWKIFWCDFEYIEI